MNENKKEQYWFKRRRYGYGWTPVTWQGWLTVVFFLVVVLYGTVALDDTPNNTSSKEALIYLVFLSINVVLLVIISSKKGPKPKWRWGNKTTDNPDEDI